MSQNEKKGHGGKHTRLKKWSGARRPAGPATTALKNSKPVFSRKVYIGASGINQLNHGCPPVRGDIPQASFLSVQK